MQDLRIVLLLVLEQSRERRIYLLIIDRKVI